MTGIYVRAFIASLGLKFSYYEKENDTGLEKYFIVFEKLKNKVNDFIGANVLKKEIGKFCSKFTTGSFRNRTNAQSKSEKCISYQREKTKIFLKKYPDVKIVSTDKGGRVVITDVKTYKAKIVQHIDENI